MFRVAVFLLCSTVVTFAPPAKETVFAFGWGKTIFTAAEGSFSTKAIILAGADVHYVPSATHGLDRDHELEWVLEGLPLADGMRGDRAFYISLLRRDADGREIGRLQVARWHHNTGSTVDPDAEKPLTWNPDLGDELEQLGIYRDSITSLETDLNQKLRSVPVLRLAFFPEPMDFDEIPAGKLEFDPMIESALQEQEKNSPLVGRMMRTYVRTVEKYGAKRAMPPTEALTHQDHYWAILSGGVLGAVGGYAGLDALGQAPPYEPGSVIVIGTAFGLVGGTVWDVAVKIGQLRPRRYLLKPLLNPVARTAIVSASGVALLRCALWLTKGS